MNCKGKWNDLNALAYQGSFGLGFGGLDIKDDVNDVDESGKYDLDVHVDKPNFSGESVNISNDIDTSTNNNDDARVSFHQ